MLGYWLALFCDLQHRTLTWCNSMHLVLALTLGTSVPTLGGEARGGPFSGVAFSRIVLSVPAELPLMPYWHFAAFPLTNSIKCVSTSLGMLLASYVTPRLSMKGAYLHQPVPFLRRFRILLRRFRFVLRLSALLCGSPLCIFGTSAAFPHTFGVLLAPSSPLGF